MPRSETSVCGPDHCSAPIHSLHLVGIPKFRYITDFTRDGSLRKLFWFVEILPVGFGAGFTQQSVPGRKSGSLWSSTCEMPGYLFFAPSDSMRFRLTWFRESFGMVDGASEAIDDNFVSQSRGNDWGVAADRDILVPIHPLQQQSAVSGVGSWMASYSDRSTGSRISGELHHRRVPSSSCQRNVGEIEIVAEAQLSTVSLLWDILKRRPELVGDDEWDPLPLCYSEIVATKDHGRIVEVLVSFVSKPRKSFIGAFVAIDVFTQRYKVLQWIRRGLSPSDGNNNGRLAQSLMSWTDKLSLARRMCERRVGPYSANPNLGEIDWTALCTSGRVDPETWNDWDDRECNSISFNSVYPDVELFNNDAVRFGTPMHHLRSRGAPVEIGYR